MDPTRYPTLSAILEAASLTDNDFDSDTVLWLEGWVLQSQEKPTNKILKDLDRKELKLAKAITLYRGYNQGKKKTLEQYMKETFGKVLTRGDVISLNQTELFSWTKSQDVAVDFATREQYGFRERIDGFVVKMQAQPQQVLLDLTKMTRVLPELRQDIMFEKELILKPGNYSATVLDVYRWK